MYRMSWIIFESVGLTIIILIIIIIFIIVFPLFCYISMYLCTALLTFLSLADEWAGGASLTA